MSLPQPSSLPPLLLDLKQMYAFVILNKRVVLILSLLPLVRLGR